MRRLRLAYLAPLALVIASCGGSGAEDLASTPAEPAVEAAPAVEETTVDVPAERTDFIVFIEELEPLEIFAVDRFVCTAYGDTHEGIMSGFDNPTVEILGDDGTSLATQEVDGKGMLSKGVCMMNQKVLNIPVSDSYTLVFSGTTVDGEPFSYESTTEFDQRKFDDGYTQGYTFEVGDES